MNFAEKLRNARKDAGMPQEMLAEALGVSRQVVTYECRGEMVEDFSDADEENVVEFNGIKSALVICRERSVDR